MQRVTGPSVRIQIGYLSQIPLIVPGLTTVKLLIRIPNQNWHTIHLLPHLVQKTALSPEAMNKG
jgi:hypothetical protein